MARVIVITSGKFGFGVDLLNLMASAVRGVR